MKSFFAITALIIGAIFTAEGAMLLGWRSYDPNAKYAWLILGVGATFLTIGYILRSHIGAVDENDNLREDDFK